MDTEMDQVDVTPIDQLTQAVTSGVLRAFQARAGAESDSSLTSILGDYGIFGTLIVIGGAFPNVGKLLPGIPFDPGASA